MHSLKGVHGPAAIKDPADIIAVQQYGASEKGIPDKVQLLFLGHSLIVEGTVEEILKELGWKESHKKTDK